MKEEENRIANPDFFGTGEEINQDDVARLENAARLQELYDKEKEERLEERFIWVCVSVILLDGILIVAIGGAWSIGPLFLLEIVLLFGAARMWGVDWAVQSMGWLMHRLAERLNRPAD